MIPVKDLAIRSISGLEVLPSDFGARVSGRNLDVPEILGRALSDLHITTALGFLSSLRSSPSSVALRMGWTPEQVQGAIPGLLEHLERHLESDVLSPPAPKRVYFGARIPVDHPRSGRDGGTKASGL